MGVARKAAGRSACRSPYVRPRTPRAAFSPVEMPANLRLGSLEQLPQRALDAEQQALPVRAAGVAAEVAAGADDAMARDDDRDRVRAEGVAGGAGGAVAAGPGRHFAVGAQLAERDSVRRLQDAPGEAVGEGPVDADVEATAAALEVLVELAPDLVEPGRDLDD